MTRRKPLSRRITALSLARNLTSKQEHQLVAMADRARHMEADLVELRERESRVRALLETPGAVVTDRRAPFNHFVTVDALVHALDPKETP